MCVAERIRQTFVDGGSEDMLMGSIRGSSPVTQTRTPGASPYPVSAYTRRGQSAPARFSEPEALAKAVRDLLRSPLCAAACTQ
jgi:hypothetical protein